MCVSSELANEGKLDREVDFIGDVEVWKVKLDI